MNFGIVGNNDGPLYLLRGLENSACKPAFVGLQKPVAGELKGQYRHALNEGVFFEGFDEPKLREKLEVFDLELLINCFCNFRFDEILTLSFPVLNVHLSPLPAYRGRHPLQWALINGEKEFGISIHEMTERYDAGKIYWQRTVPVKQGMSVQQLRTILMEKLQHGFHNFLLDYEYDRLEPLKNDDKIASYVPRRYPQDSKLTEWDNSRTIVRKVQALRSEDYPAYFCFNGYKITCLYAAPGETSDHKHENPVISQLKNRKCNIACLDGQSVWLDCAPENFNHLQINETIQQSTRKCH